MNDNEWLENIESIIKEWRAGLLSADHAINSIEEFQYDELLSTQDDEEA